MNALARRAQTTVHDTLRARGRAFFPPGGDPDARYPQWRQDLTAAVETARRSGDDRVLVSALKALGQIERDIRQVEAARARYQEAVTVARRVGDPILLAHTVRHLGDVEHDLGSAERAAPCFDEALAHYRASADTTPLDLANAVRPLALLKEEVGEVEAACALWTEARDLYRQVGAPDGVDECERHLQALTSPPTA